MVDFEADAFEPHAETAGVTESGWVWERDGRTIHLYPPLPLPPGEGWLRGPTFRYEVATED